MAAAATIGPGDRVSFVDRFGVTRTGKAVMKGPAGWVLNMGGKYGTPAVPSPGSIVKVTKAKGSHAAGCGCALCRLSAARNAGKGEV